MRIWAVPQVLFYASKCCSFTRISERIFHILTQVLIVAQTILIANWYWQISSNWSVIMICAQNSPVQLNFIHIQAKAVALGWISNPYFIFRWLYSIWPRMLYCQMGVENILCRSCHNMTQDIFQGLSGAPERAGPMLFHSSDMKMCTWDHISGAPQLGNWHMIQSPSWHHPQYPTHAMYHEIGQLGTWIVAYQATSAKSEIGFRKWTPHTNPSPHPPPIISTTGFQSSTRLRSVQWHDRVIMTF